MNAERPIRAALLTPAAPGAIAVIRVVGAGALALLAPLLRKPNNNEMVAPPAGRPALARIVDGDEVVDEALIVRREMGGQDDVELSVHGGVAVTQRVLGLLASHGVAIVAAEALPHREPVHPVETDVDRALQTCESRRLTQFLLAQRGLLPAFLGRAAAVSEAERAAYNRRTQAAIRVVAGLRVVLVGPPNAGKSTLANGLIGRDRVIIADQPGTTRDWVSETALIDGWPVTLTDTAGVRETDDAIEAEAIRRGREQAGAGDLIVVVLDATRGASAMLADAAAIGAGLIGAAPRLITVNKCDVADRAELARVRETLPDCIEIAAKQGTGLDSLGLRLAALLRVDQLDEAVPTGFLETHLLS